MILRNPWFLDEASDVSAGLFVVGRFVSKPLVARQCHPVFRIDSQTVGDTVDVVEVADDLRCDGDLVVVESVLAERGNVRFFHFAWPERQLDGEITQRTIGV